MFCFTGERVALRAMERDAFGYIINITSCSSAESDTLYEISLLDDELKSVFRYHVIGIWDTGCADFSKFIKKLPIDSLLKRIVSIVLSTDQFPKIRSIALKWFDKSVDIVSSEFLSDDRNRYNFEEVIHGIKEILKQKASRSKEALTSMCENFITLPNNSDLEYIIGDLSANIYLQRWFLGQIKKSDYGLPKFLEMVRETSLGPKTVFEVKRKELQEKLEASLKCCNNKKLFLF